MDYSSFAEELRNVMQDAEENIRNLGYKKDDIEEVISNIEVANATLETALNYIDDAVDSAQRLEDDYIPQAQDILNY